MRESELLFTSILRCDRMSLYLRRNSLLNKCQSMLVSSVLRRRISGEPIDYILGKTEFMGLEFKVNADVLIPRPDTEILIDTVLKKVAVQNTDISTLRILDIGTGSGCIAVSLAKFLPAANIFATDISGKALSIAKANARLHNIKDRLKFINCNLLNCDELRTLNYHFIVSNPPYIPSAQIAYLQPEVQREPRIALDGGEDGLDFYRSIVRDAPAHLNAKGFLIMEMGYNQGKAIKNIIQDSADFEIIEIVKDYANIDRVVVARKYGR